MIQCVNKFFFRSNLEAENIRTLMLPQTGGRAAKVADFFNVGTRAHLQNALAKLRQLPGDSHRLKAFYQAFNARVQEKGIVVPKVDALRALLDTDAQRVMPEFAKLSMQEVVNSREVLSMGLSEVSHHLDAKMDEISSMFGSYFSRRTARAQLMPLINQGLEKQGFNARIIREEKAIQESKDNRGSQEAHRHVTRREGWHRAYQDLATRVAKYGSSASTFAAVVTKNNKIAEQRRLSAVTHLENIGVKAVSCLTQQIELLVAAVEKKCPPNKVAIISELNNIRNTLIALLIRLQKEPFSIEDVRHFIQESNGAIAALEKMLENKTGLDPVRRSLSQLETALWQLKKEAKNALKNVQNFDFSIAAVHEAQHARQVDRQNVDRLRDHIAIEDRFFAQSQTKQSQAIAREYEAELKRRMTVVSDLKSYLDIPSATEQVFNFAKTTVKIALVATSLIAAGAALYHHLRKPIETIPTQEPIPKSSLFTHGCVGLLGGVTTLATGIASWALLRNGIFPDE